MLKQWRGSELLQLMKCRSDTTLAVVIDNSATLINFVQETSSNPNGPRFYLVLPGSACSALNSRRTQIVSVLEGSSRMFVSGVQFHYSLNINDTTWVFTAHMLLLAAYTHYMHLVVKASFYKVLRPAVTSLVGKTHSGSSAGSDSQHYNTWSTWHSFSSLSVSGAADIHTRTDLF